MTNESKCFLVVAIKTGMLFATEGGEELGQADLTVLLGGLARLIF